MKSPISSIALALRLFVRDWRAGELRVLIAALVIAVGSVTTVSFFADRVGRTIVHEASQLLGADLVVVSGQPIDFSIGEKARETGLQTSRAVRFRSMVRFGEDNLLTEVKAIGEGYPLRGRLHIRRQLEGDDFAPNGIPEPGKVWVDARLIRRLGISIGDIVALGERRFEVSALVSEEPESSAGFLNLGPRLMFNDADLASTELIVPGSRVQYRLFVAGDRDALQTFRPWVDSQLLIGQRVETIRDARPEIRSGLKRAERFLDLSALLAVVLAAVAVALAARRHLQRHLDACAMMRCLGALQNEVLWLHALQFVTAGTIATLIGCGIGFFCQYLLASVLAPLIQVPLPPPGLLPVLHGLATGFVLLLGFALPPLIALRKVPTMRVLRRDIGRPDPAGLGAYMLGSAAIAALVLWQAEDFALGAFVLAGVVGTIVACAVVTVIAIHFLRRTFEKAGFGWRMGLANIRRRQVGSVLQVVSIGLGLMSLILLTLVRNELLVNWQNALPPDAPNRFLVNIRSDQIAGLQQFLGEHDLSAPRLYPMVRARLTAVNGNPVSADDYADERARRLINREFNLSWSDTLQTDNRVVDGRWFDANDHGKALISVEDGIAETLGMSVGDVLSYDVAGAELKVTIASLREVQWDSFRVNFFVLAPPGVLESYPASWVTSFHLPREEAAVLDTLVRDFSNLIIIDVEAVLGQIVRMMDQVVRAVEFVFAFSLAAGVLVLLAAIASTHDERRLDAAVMRTLGATSRQLRTVQITEFIFIGALAGLFAALGATLVGWALAHNVLNVPYQISPTVWIIGLIAGAVTVTVAGLAGTYRLIRTAPMEVYRTVV
jgi:putative ABC transport system permease protein